MASASHYWPLENVDGIHELQETTGGRQGWEQKLGPQKCASLRNQGQSRETGNSKQHQLWSQDDRDEETFVLLTLNNCYCKVFSLELLYVLMIKRQHLCFEILISAFSPTTLKQKFSALTCTRWINLCMSQDVCFLGRHKWHNLHACQSRGPFEPRAKGCASED